MDVWVSDGGRYTFVRGQVSVRGDSNGKGGTERVGWWSRCVISEVNSSVVSVCSSHLLALRVRSGVGVDGCRDRIGSAEELDHVF
jgi:hypothetical protein